MRTRQRFGPVVLGVVVALLLGEAGQADAGFMVSLDAGSPTGTGPFTFDYAASIPGADVISPGDLLRISDFAGLVGTPTAPPGWAVTVADTDPALPGVTLTHGDDPAIPNITFTWTGSPLHGPASIDGFVASSTLSGAAGITDFVGKDTAAIGGKVVVSIGDVQVPSPAASAAPEPASVMLLGIGALGLLGYGWRRRKQATATA
jgi:hypothetical protein